MENISVVPPIEFPEVKNLKFSASDRANTYNFTYVRNGKISQTYGIELNIIITPELAGDYYIDGIYYYDKNNQKKKTGGFNLKVIKPIVSNAMLVEIIPNKQKYYVGEKIILDLHWYLKNKVQNLKLNFSLLDKKIFYNLQNIPLPNNLSRQIFNFSPLDNIPFSLQKVKKNGENYSLYSTKFSLFIENEGEWKDAKFSVKGDVLTPTQQLDFFGKQIWRYNRVFAENPLLELKILPLPPNPANFTGAVGNFQISKKVNPTNIKVGEPITFQFLVQGDGNFHSITPPVFKEWEKDFEVYYRPENLRIGENFAEFFYTIRPKNNSVTEIPPIDFVYFDLQSETYATQTLAATFLQVQDAESLTLDNIISYAPTNNEQDFSIDNVVIEPNFTITPASSIGIFFPSVFLLFPPLVFFALMGFFAQKEQQFLRKQKKAILAKYQVDSKASFNKQILAKMLLFLLHKGIEEKKLQSFLFHQEKIPKIKGCSKEQVLFLTYLRDLYNEIYFSKKIISPEEKTKISQQIEVHL